MVQKGGLQVDPFRFIELINHLCPLFVSTQQHVTMSSKCLRSTEERTAVPTRLDPVIIKGVCAATPCAIL